MGIPLPMLREDNLFFLFLFPICFPTCLHFHKPKSTAIFVSFDPRGVSLEMQGRWLWICCHSTGGSTSLCREVKILVKFI